MDDKKKETPEETPDWNPPEPPWNPEPKPLTINEKTAKYDPDAPKQSFCGCVGPCTGHEEESSAPEPVNTSLVAKLEEMVEDGDLDLKEIVKDISKDESSTEAETARTDGLFEYTVKCPTGITINGKVYEGGPHMVDEGTYETLSTLDAPYR